MNHKTAIQILLVLLSMVIVFHVCIMAKIIPYTIAWGGQITNDKEMYVFETISIVINVFLGFILLMKGNYIAFQFKEKTVNIVLWVFLVIFMLNTVGNIFAKTNFEKFFALLTLLFAILIWKILRKNKAEPTTHLA
ncbi:hypothetical protein [Pedobacter immunditicola]|uniref:hypothetical protein n=1 Tax=Pedobacter immunditicola TaxID=3133440 RepID=UPI0030B0C521